MTTARPGLARTAKRAMPALVALAVGVAVGVLGSDLASTTVAGSDVSPGPILVSADQRTLAGTVGGSCSSGFLKVDETARTVTVVLHRSPQIMLAPGSCGIETFVGRLNAPLGSRRLVDGVTHAALPTFDGAGILRPAYLPTGFIHRYDTATFPNEYVAGGVTGCVQVYTQDSGYDESIWISQRDGGVWSAPEDVTPQPITVRGQPGMAIPGEIEWTEHGQLITIESRTYAYAILSTADLVRIAAGLR